MSPTRTWKGNLTVNKKGWKKATLQPWHSPYNLRRQCHDPDQATSSRHIVLKKVARGIKKVFKRLGCRFVKVLCTGLVGLVVVALAGLARCALCYFMYTFTSHFVISCIILVRHTATSADKADILPNSVWKQTLFAFSLMNNVSFYILFLQVCFASELGGIRGDQVGNLIRMKDGKIFLQHSSKKALWPKKDAEEGRDNSNDDKIKVTWNKDLFCF